MYDKKHRVKEQTIKVGDKVLIKQQKTRLGANRRRCAARRR